MKAGLLTLKVWRSRQAPVTISLVTQISGWFADQTALFGLLEHLYDLGRVILAVEQLEMNEDTGVVPGFPK